MIMKLNHVPSDCVLHITSFLLAEEALNIRLLCQTFRHQKVFTNLFPSTTKSTIKQICSHRLYSLLKISNKIILFPKIVYLDNSLTKNGYSPIEKPFPIKELEFLSKHFHDVGIVFSFSCMISTQYEKFLILKDKFPQFMFKEPESLIFIDRDDFEKFNIPNIVYRRIHSLKNYLQLPSYAKVFKFIYNSSDVFPFMNRSEWLLDISQATSLTTLCTFSRYGNNIQIQGVQESIVYMETESIIQNIQDFKHLEHLYLNNQEINSCFISSLSLLKNLRKLILPKITVPLNLTSLYSLEELMLDSLETTLLPPNLKYLKYVCRTLVGKTKIEWPFPSFPKTFQIFDIVFWFSFFDTPLQERIFMKYFVNESHPCLPETLKKLNMMRKEDNEIFISTSILPESIKSQYINFNRFYQEEKEYILIPKYSLSNEL